MDWLLLAALGIIWMAFLFPLERRKASPRMSVTEFERGMEILAETRRGGGEGRWMLAPKKGVPFLGSQGRARARARDRRRRVFVFLLESSGLTFLIGLVPPLRGMWAATGVLVGLLLLYVWALLSIRERAARARTLGTAPATKAPANGRYATEGNGRVARPSVGGLSSLDPDDPVHVVVFRASELQAAGA